MLYRSYLYEQSTDREIYLTTLMADNDADAIAAVSAWISQHKRASPGRHEIRIYSDESRAFVRATIEVT